MLLLMILQIVLGFSQAQLTSSRDWQATEMTSRLFPGKKACIASSLSLDNSEQNSAELMVTVLQKTDGTYSSPFLTVSHNSNDVIDATLTIDSAPEKSLVLLQNDNTPALIGRLNDHTDLIAGLKAGAKVILTMKSMAGEHLGEHIFSLSGSSAAINSVLNTCQ